MKTGAILAGLAGLFGAIWLAFHVGIGAVLAAAVSVGWSGFATLCLYGAANFVLLGTAWLVLDPPYTGRKAVTYAWARAVRDSAGEILPFSQLGGLVIGVRAAAVRGIAAPVASAGTVVDMTLEMIAQILFILAGLLLLVLNHPLADLRLPIVRDTAAGIVAALVLAGGFLALQRRGFSFLERVSQRLLPAATAGMSAMHHALDAIHVAPMRMFGGFLIHTAGWLSSAFGTWLALHLIGTRMPFADAVIVESLLCAARSAAIFIPAAIGVQEAGYMLLLPLFGLPPQAGLAISLLKRAREIVLGIPVLLSWQIVEGSNAVWLERERAAASPK
ncbi:MAG TPA: lysylphosphatidylglycerol synthase domain-containing protein [Rhizomicrobium sp.]|jgi:putative membrane protein